MEPQSRPAFQLDRVEPAIFRQAHQLLGFIRETLDEDGDELDVLLITEQPLATGIFLEAESDRRDEICGRWRSGRQNRVRARR